MNFPWKTAARPHWLIPVAAVCLVMGGLLAVQVRSQKDLEERLGAARPGLLGTGGGVADMASLLGAAKKREEEQQGTIEDLRQKLAQYEKAAAKEHSMVKPLSDDLQTSKMALGLVPVKGPGIVLEVDDSTLRIGTNSPGVEDQTPFVIHDFDLLQIANELWAAGAEAITLNDQRLVAHTAIRCVGPTIQVNNVPIGSPYRFCAVGDSKVLSSALNMPDGVLDRLRPMQFKIRLEEKIDLVLPAIGASRSFRFAKPAPITATTSGQEKQ